MERLSEEEFASLFVRPTRREWFLDKIQDKSTRNAAIARVCNHPDVMLDPAKVRLIGTDVDKFGDYYLFIDEHENDYVRILSTELGIDQWEMGLGDAVEMCKTTSDASIIMGYGFAMLRGEMKIEGIQRSLVTL